MKKCTFLSLHSIVKTIDSCLVTHWSRQGNPHSCAIENWRTKTQVSSCEEISGGENSVIVAGIWIASELEAIWRTLTDIWKSLKIDRKAQSLIEGSLALKQKI